MEGDRTIAVVVGVLVTWRTWDARRRRRAGREMGDTGDDDGPWRVSGGTHIGLVSGVFHNHPRYSCGEVTSCRGVMMLDREGSVWSTLPAVCCWTEG